MSAFQAGYIRWVVEPIFVMKKFCGSLSVANSLQAYSFVPYFRVGGGLSNLKFPCFHILSDCDECLSGRVYKMGSRTNIRYEKILW